MKITFLCGSMEPGKDGVGDYTRRLAAALFKKNISTSIIALNDTHIKGLVETKQEQDQELITVLRLGCGIPWSQRFERVQSWIESWNPEWLSLQYVPYSFHKRGMPWQLTRRLKNLGQGRKWHFMFHELWIGMEAESGSKAIITGWLQKKIIQGLVRNIKPDVSHTQCKLYLMKLQRLGIAAEILPLYSNIPVNKAEKLSKYEKNKRANGKISLITFGTIQKDTPIKEFAKEAAIYASKNKISISLTIIGRANSEQDRWLSTWEAEGMEGRILGEQPAELLSEFLTKSSFGIATTNLGKIEKSGSVAAMREHKLPIICLSRPWRGRGEEVQNMKYSDIKDYKKGYLKDCLEGEYSFDSFLSISEISTCFIQALSSSEKNKRSKKRKSAKSNGQYLLQFYSCN